jgi:CheY-like chemotaxis protein
MPHPRHVLLVDDEEQMRMVLARLVKRTWADVTIAETANGAEALCARGQQRPDLIIADYQMPVMNGLELVRTLRAQGATMPILVLSSEPRVGETILAAGADHFLLKPVARGMFTQILRTLLPDDEETRAIGQ